jgi:hypothetical protein
MLHINLIWNIIPLEHTRSICARTHENACLMTHSFSNENNNIYKKLTRHTHSTNIITLTYSMEQSPH